MRETRAKSVEIVRAVEEADREGRLLMHSDRAEATRSAIDSSGLGQEIDTLLRARDPRVADLVVRRADRIREILRQQRPRLARALAGSRWARFAGVAVIGLSLLAGAMTNALGTERQINLLFFPLLGLLAWNAAAYAAKLALAVGGRFVRRASVGVDDGKPASQPAGLAGALAPALSDAWFRLQRRVLGKPGDGSPDESLISALALAGFASRWHRATARLRVARVERLLHLCAAAMMVGLVAGMYVRGLAFEYRAAWESTLLDAGQVQALLDTLLAPASALSGLEVPDVAPLRRPTAGGPAAVWLHLYSLTSLLVVLAPRTILAAFAHRRARRLSSGIEIDLDEPYYTRMLAAWRGSARIVEILPYSYTPGPGTTDGLKSALHDRFGARADLRLLEPVAYGEDLERDSSEVGRPSNGDPFLVLLFNLAQPPETEVHGSFLEGLEKRSKAGGSGLVVLVDLAAFRRRGHDDRRLEERKQAWQRVVNDAGLDGVFVDLERLDVDALLESLSTAVWPPSETDGAR